MKKDLSKYEEKLKETEKALEAELAGHRAEIPEMGSDVDSYDTETDEAEEYSNELGIKQVLKNRLRAVRAALEKIKAGTYGHCANCKMDIPEKVLDVNPESDFCQHCKNNRQS